MPTLNDLIDGDPQRLDTGFTFTEGPLYHPDGFYYFVDVRESKFYRIKPGEKAELLRENTGEGNGTTFDPQGRLIQCEGGNRRVTRWPADGTFASSEVLMDRFNGKRLSRPNDVVCKSDGSVYFTNPGLRIPLGERELDPSAVYRIMPDGSNQHVADFEYPNGLAFSPDERVLYVANTRHAAYIHRIELDSAGNMVRRSIFADMSSDEKIGVPDGMKGRCAGQRLLHRPRRHLGLRGGRHPYRHDQDARSAGQSRLWRTGHEDAVFHRTHFGLQHAREGGGSAGASVQERLTGRSSSKLAAADAACRASWQPAIRTTSGTGLPITSTGHFLRAGL